MVEQVVQEEEEAMENAARKVSKEMIVDLVPGPVMLMTNGSSSGKSAKASSKTSSVSAAADKKSNGATSTTKKTTTTSSTAATVVQKETVAAGDKKAKKSPPARSNVRNGGGGGSQVDSNRPQYLHLSLEQIQELALKQQAGTLFVDQLQQEQHHHQESSCSVHSHGATAGSVGGAPAAKKADRNRNGGTGTKDSQQSAVGARKPLAAAANKENKNSNNSNNKTNNRNGKPATGPVTNMSANLQSPNLIKNLKGVKGGKSDNDKALIEQPEVTTATNGVSSDGAKPAGEGAKNALESPGLIKDIRAVGGGGARPGSTGAAAPTPASKEAAASSSAAKAPAVRKPSPMRKPLQGPAAGSGGGRSLSPTSKPKPKAMTNGTGGAAATTAEKDHRKASTESSGSSSVTSNKENEAAAGRRSSAAAAADGKVREKTLKKADMLFGASAAGGGGRKSKNGSSAAAGKPPAPPAPSATTEVTAKGGFLAPTQAWLSHMGEKLDFKSRSPSPSRREGQVSATVIRKPLDRSPSPRQRRPGGGNTRDSSIEPPPRRQQSLGGPPAKAPVRNQERNPSLPTIRRSGSLRAAKPADKPPATDGVGKVAGGPAGVKRSASLKKQASDLSSASLVRKSASGSKPDKTPPAATVRVNGSAGKTAESGEFKGHTSPPKAPTVKKEPPPVPPRPEKER